MKLLKGGDIGLYIRGVIGVIKGDTRSLGCSSCRVEGWVDYKTPNRPLLRGGPKNIYG